MIIMITIPDLVKKKKKKRKKKNRTQIVDFAVLVDQRMKIKESDKRDKYLDLARELEMLCMDHEGDGDTNCNWCA